MKKWLSFLMLAICSHASVFAKQHKYTQDETSVQKQEIMTLQQFSEQIAQGIELEKLKDLILECPAGTLLPLRLTIRGDVLTFDSGSTIPLNIKIVQSCYLKHHGKGLLFSTDLRQWQRFTDFFSGKAAAVLTFNDQNPIANVDLEINQQKNRWEINFGPKSSICKNVYSYHVEYHPYPVYHWNMEQTERSFPTQEVRRWSPY